MLKLSGGDVKFASVMTLLKREVGCMTLFARVLALLMLA
jgi:hypothetical protein